METIKGIDAMRLAQEVSKINGGNFTLMFYPYNRKTGEASGKLTTKERCTYRAQLPQDKWEADGDTYFLYLDEHGQEKTAHRILCRFIAFAPDYKLRKIEWLK